MKKITALILITFLAGLSMSGETPEPKLKPGDVEHFLETYPAVSQQLQDLGMEYEAESGEYNLPDAIRFNQEFLGILEQHGWDENFFSVMSVIMQGYTVLAYQNEMPEIDRKMADAIKEIEANTALSEAMKKQLIEQLKASQGLMAGQQSAMQQSIHPDDLALIGEHMEAIKALLDENR